MDKIQLDALYAARIMDIDLERLSYKARDLDLHLLDKNFVILCDIHKEGTNNSYGEDMKFAKEKICSVFRNALRERFIFALLKPTEILLLVGFSRSQNGKEAYEGVLKEIFCELQKEIVDINSRFKLSAGVSSSVEESTVLKKAYTEAYMAKELGKKISKKDGIFFYEDLGIYKFLRIPDKEEVLQDENIRCIYEYDREHNANLIDTLEAFMDSNGKIKETAKKVFAHPNTVKYRLKKITELAGDDILKNENKRFYYYVMVKAIKLISD